MMAMLRKEVSWEVVIKVQALKAPQM